MPTYPHKEFYVFGMDTWSSTPGPKIEYTGDRGGICRIALGKDLLDLVATAMQQPGGW